MQQRLPGRCLGICMVSISFLLCTRGVARAQAWSVASTACRRSCTSVSPVPRFLSSRSSSNEEGEISTESDLTPVTGWNHNLPSKSSSFWQTGDSPSSGTNTKSEDEEQLRTGWLHNTASKKETTKTENQNTAQEQDPNKPSKARRLLEVSKMKQARNHRIVSPPAFHACGGGRQVVVTEHKISVPLWRAVRDDGILQADGSPTNATSIDVYFSIVEKVKPDETGFYKSLNALSPTKRADAYVQAAGMTDAQDMLVYLQGGPGFGAPTPIVSLGLTVDGSWAGKALGMYKCIVLMDQRGTGRSTPITKQTLEKRFPGLFVLDDETANENVHLSLDDLDADYPNEAVKVRDALSHATDYMTQFRADSIVKDAELIKDALMLPLEEEVPRPWGAALGQSFGGFCMMTYLSQVDHPPKICLLTGGVAPMLTSPFDAYKSLWERVKERSLLYYDMYPGDISVVRTIVRSLLEKPVVLPSGGRLTARRFLNLGMSLGGSPSAFASLHALVSTAFVDPQFGNDTAEFTRAFLKRIDSEQSFDDHPIYFLLHESIYADGPTRSPTNWAAHRAYESLIKTPSEYDYRLTSKLDSDERPTLFFGEMVFPWFAADDFAEVSGLGMRCLAHALAEKDDWGPLYNAEHMRQVLQDGTVSKAAAALYLDDMYVDFNEASKVVSRGGPLENCKVWASNEYQHSGLRDNGAFIFDKLHGMATGSVRTPS